MVRCVHGDTVGPAAGAREGLEPRMKLSQGHCGSHWDRGRGASLGPSSRPTPPCCSWPCRHVPCPAVDPLQPPQVTGWLL